ncbi:MAG: hypothetical protein HY297_00925 [Thaumarchaeota archaeon]|nr:hypothetical protein [Nitrososphaerota archaeon]
MAFDIFWMNIAAIFALLNVALVVILGALYFQSWRRLKSGATMSLLAVASFFLLQNIVIVVFWYVLYGQVPAAQPLVEAAAPYLVLINALETVALGNLVRLTWK